jgi:hypothetical protein
LKNILNFQKKEIEKMHRVIHNGYTIELFDTAAEAEKYIFDRLAEYKDLCPKQIFQAYGNDNKADERDIKYHADGYKTLSVMVFQYKTLYTEMFMIQERI